MKRDITFLLNAIVTGPTKGWMKEAYCVEHEIPTAVFFPDPEGSGRGHAPDWSEAREACRRCEVESECLAFAFANKIKFGMFGGKTPDERSALRGVRPRSKSARALYQALSDTPSAS